MAAETGFIPKPPLLNPRTGFITSNFAVKAIFLVFSVVLLSLYPSRAPDVISGSFLNQGWELLHLLLVGIAVSYGLFSRRNADPEAEKAMSSATTATAVNKADASLSYLSRMNLRVATVFDEDDDELVESEPVINETRMWKSRYRREEPAVVVAEKRPSHNAKPLCLPVRSLRPQQVPKPAPADQISRDEAQVPKPAPADQISRDEALQGFTSAVGGGANQRSGYAARVSRTENTGGPGGFNNVGLGREEEMSTEVVLPSPIPWRSRSGRFEPKFKPGNTTPPPSPRPPKAGTPLSPNPVSPRPSSVGSPTPPNPASPTPRPPNNGGSFIPSNVDTGISRTPSFRSANTRKPPPPPPPPPRFYSPSVSAEVGAEVVEDVPKRKGVRSRTPSVLPPPPPPPPPPAYSLRHKLQFGTNGQQTRRSFKDEFKGMDSTSGGPEHVWNAWNAEAQEVARERPAEPEPEPPQQKTSPKNGEKKNRKKKRRPPRRFIVESDSSSDGSTTEDVEENGGASSSATDDADADANEVDKKADEFIAKFREQIRLQRIESIKKSAQQRQRADRSTT